MRLRTHLALFGAASVAVAAPAMAAQPLYVVRSETMALDLKEPYKAYALGLVPFYSVGAASYVGTSRFSWRTPPDLQRDAWAQTAVDLGLLAAGLVLYRQSSMDGGSGGFAVDQYLVGSLVSWALIPATHLWLYAPFWGNAAVQFNRRQVDHEGFSVPDGH